MSRFWQATAAGPAEWHRWTAAVLVVAGSSLLAAGCGSVSPSREPQNPLMAREVAVLAPVETIFNSESVWKLDIAHAPLAADSDAAAANVAAQVAGAYGGVAAFNAHNYAVSYNVAGPDTPTTNVVFDDCQHKGYTPTGLLAQFAGVPIPADAVPSRGTDSTLSIYQPSTDRMWDLWRASRTATGWQACFGGRMDHVSTSPGFFTAGFGASATGLPYVGGMIGIQETRSGHIDHALALELIAPATYAHVSYPAQRSDGSSAAPSAVEEGQRLRLDPSVDVGALGLTPLATMVAKAAQTYGFIVTDSAGSVAVSGESGAAAERITGQDPWQALERGVPDYAVLNGFPWSRLQVLPPDYGRP